MEGKQKSRRSGGIEGDEWQRLSLSTCKRGRETISRTKQGNNVNESWGRE